MIMQRRLKVCDWPALCPWHLLALCTSIPCHAVLRLSVHTMCAQVIGLRALQVVKSYLL